MKLASLTGVRGVDGDEFAIIAKTGVGVTAPLAGVSFWKVKFAEVVAFVF